MLKRLAAFVLLCCFFLPLSKCTWEDKLQGKTVQHEDIHYPYASVMAGIGSLGESKATDKLWLLAELAVFFVPAACLMLSEKLQTWIHVLAAPAAQFMLYVETWFYSGLQYGGVLAIACWGLLFLLACSELWQRWRGRRLQLA